MQKATVLTLSTIVVIILLLVSLLSLLLFFRGGFGRASGSLGGLGGAAQTGTADVDLEIGNIFCSSKEFYCAYARDHSYIRADGSEGFVAKGGGCGYPGAAAYEGDYEKCQDFCSEISHPCKCMCKE